MTCAMWVLLAGYLSGFVAVLGMTLADNSWPDKLDAAVSAAVWPIAWLVLLVECIDNRRRSHN